MKIQKLKLYTNKLVLEKQFYSETLGFEILESTVNHFTLKIGWSELTFEKSEKDYKYHYCFLIPSNKLNQAIEWMEKRVPILDLENGRKTQRFESWNADSFYFYDASGNIAEFIVRHELKNAIESDFKISDVLCVNEIGIPTSDVEKMNNQLQEKFGTKFWKGDPLRFGTNGSQEGLFLLPNYNLKDFWFPTSIKIKPEPFSATIKNNDQIFYLEYKNEEIKNYS
ncbi:glyoxalase [uncultured Aquimarina sp.]|uniref:VOC family protein n=1 Tax=uncultured Aquimarina sp. TaxID=575652 RepID=UPI0026149207|nr:glyoxalase [uncultured Aquimarina sp.]